jgi:hypothetical protein
MARESGLEVFDKACSAGSDCAVIDVYCHDNEVLVLGDKLEENSLVDG